MTEEKESIEDAIDDIKKHALAAALEWLAANAKVIGIIVAVVAFVNLGFWTYLKTETESFCNTLFPADEYHMNMEQHFQLMVSNTEEANIKCDKRIQTGAENCAQALADCAANEVTQ